MNFLKKNILLFVGLVLIFLLVAIPSIRKAVGNAFFPVAAVESAVHFDDSDFDIELKGINTPNTNLKSLKSQKLLFLNFWGTWCAPCRKEWPSIQNLYNAKKGKVTFVLIAMQDEEEKVMKFLEENKYNVPVYLAESPIGPRILPKVFPTTYLLDGKGRILLKEDASKDWNASSVHQFIDQIIP